MKTKQPAVKKKTRTPRQTEASRRNGRKSKGPVTKAGLEKSSRNSVKHGLFCSVMQRGPMPVFANREEFIQMVQKMNADFGVTTAMGRSLVESLAMDMLRLRHVRAMELTILDPGIDNDRHIDAALLNRQITCGQKSEEEIENLRDACIETQSQLTGGTGMRVREDTADCMAAELWSLMNYARPNLEKAQKERDKLDAAIAADPENHVRRENHIRLQQQIANIEDFMQHTDKEVFHARSEPDVKAFITGKKRLAKDQRQKWIKLIGICRSNQESILAKIMQVDDRINARKREHIRESVDKLDKLKQLGEYESQIRRSIIKTTELIKEVEKMAVIDVL